MCVCSAAVAVLLVHMLLLSENAYLCAVAPLGQGSLGEGREQQETAVEQPLGTEAHFCEGTGHPLTSISHAPCALLLLQLKMQRQQYAKHHLSLHNPKQFPRALTPCSPLPTPVWTY
eukprot:15717-Heterococcus_DN1.PRE.3